MIDWLTLRIPLTESLGPVVFGRLQQAIGKIVSIRPDGSKAWEKASLDFEQLRSDMPGLFWTVQGSSDGQSMLVIGGSPASIEHGINVFGSDDIHHCACVLVRFAGRCLDAILPPVERWQCRRVDVTENYDMGSFHGVKQALRILMGTDSSRRKASSDRYGGDTVYWSPKSDLITGKAYHKGPQIRHLARKNKLSMDDPQAATYADLADRILRLELKLGARWFRRLEEKSLKWLDLASATLTAIHDEFFARFIGKLEVTDMSSLQTLCEQVAPTPGQGKGAYCVWLNIRAVGYEQAKNATSRTTWFRALKILRLAGLSDADLCASNVVQLRRRELVLSAPLRSWSDLLKAA
jgi:II/X family phage/plasmid replication protein